VKKFILLLTLLICVIISDPVLGADYPPPKIICYIQGTPLDSTKFGQEFCWVGDQNGDGSDDLLVSHDPDEKGRPSKADRVELLYGGNPMDDQYDRFFTIPGLLYGCGRTLAYVGNLLSKETRAVVLENYFWETSYQPSEHFVSICSIAPEWKESSEFIITSHRPLKTIPAKGGHRFRPIDFNGDGYHDLILVEQLEFEDSSRIGRINTYYGGIDFDTLPDWSVVVPGMYDNYSVEVSSGYDVNGDGYGDFIIMYRYRDMNQPGLSAPRYSLFLGGHEPDTVHVLTWDSDHFPNRDMPSGFSLLPDINGDGYDEWGMYFIKWGGFTDGYYVFFGSDSLDLEPDLELMGNSSITGGGGADLCGGDFNGDGYGDIVTSNGGGYNGEGQINITFGRPGLPKGKIYMDIRINGDSGEFLQFEQLGQKVGAVGDYNGDGVEDFVAYTYLPPKTGPSPAVLVLAGNKGWSVGVASSTGLIPVDLTLQVYPNPLNGELKIKLALPVNGKVAVDFYDLNGRKVDSIADLAFPAGEHTLNWNVIDLPAGIYYLLLHYSTSTSERTISRKIVVLK